MWWWGFPPPPTLQNKTTVRITQGEKSSLVQLSHLDLWNSSSFPVAAAAARVVSATAASWLIKSHHLKPSLQQWHPSVLGLRKASVLPTDSAKQYPLGILSPRRLYCFKWSTPLYYRTGGVLQEKQGFRNFWMIISPLAKLQSSFKDNKWLGSPVFKRTLPQKRLFHLYP